MHYDFRSRSVHVKIPSSVMIPKIRQYISVKTGVYKAKVFAESVDITHSGFDRQR
jgi:hypothetical protein